MPDFKLLDQNVTGLFTEGNKQYDTVRSIECLLITFTEMNQLI
jgi:hypothetical protein